MDRPESVEVVYALPRRALSVAVAFSPGLTVHEALQQSGLLSVIADADRESLQVGVFGERRELESPLVPGDRVEVYRRLVQDPKDQRRERLKAVRRRAIKA